MEWEHFLDSLENVPPESERNFTLIRELDDRTQQVIKQIEDCIAAYKATNSRSKRAQLKLENEKLFEKLNSYAEDKAQLAIQTYELIDKTIKRLVGLNITPATIDGGGDGDAKPAHPIGFDMPRDPNEPTYCFCGEISHGEMIACDSKECDIEWFHYSCVNITEPPKGSWYCGTCLPRLKAQYRKRSASKRRRR